MHNSSTDNRQRFEGKLQSASQCASNEFRRFVGDVEELVKVTTQATGEELTQAKLKLSERIDSAKKTAEEFGDTIIDKAKKSAATTNQYVHDHSWAVVGASIASSLLVGYMLSRQSK